jgi:arylsulfatase
MPDKLKQMQDLFYAEAKKHDVLPLDNSTLARWNTPRPNLTGDRTEFTYTGALAGVPNSGAPSILNKAYTITAEVTIPAGGAEGMIVTDGGRFGGYGLFLSPSFNWWSQADLFRNLGLGFLIFGLLLVWRGRSKNWSGLKMNMSRIVVLLASLLVVAVFATRFVNIGRGKPVFLYNLLDLKRTTWVGPALGAGKHTIVFDYKPDEPGLGKSGKGVLTVDGKEVAKNSVEHGTPVTFPEDESFDIGSDTRTGVAMLEYRYDPPFKFTGKIDKLTFKLEPRPKPAPQP